MDKNEKKSMVKLRGIVIHNKKYNIWEVAVSEECHQHIIWKK